MSFTRTITIAASAAVAALGAFAGAAPASSAAATKCVTLYDQPDAGSKVCYFSEGPCAVGEYRTTFIGTEFYCYVSRP